jgi:hypothetical protein
MPGGHSSPTVRGAGFQPAIGQWQAGSLPHGAGIPPRDETVYETGGSGMIPDRSLIPGRGGRVPTGINGGGPAPTTRDIHPEAALADGPAGSQSDELL